MLELLSFVLRRQIIISLKKISNFFPSTISKNKKESERKIDHLREGNHLDSLRFFLTSFFH